MTVIGDKPQKFYLYYYVVYDKTQTVKLCLIVTVDCYSIRYCWAVIRHINPLMFGVMDDEPEGVAQRVYHV